MKFYIFPHTTLTLEVAMLLISLIYPIIHDSWWLTCLALLWNPPPMHYGKKRGVITTNIVKSLFDTSNLPKITV